MGGKQMGGMNKKGRRLKVTESLPQPLLKEGSFNPPPSGGDGGGLKGTVYLIHFSEPYITATGRRVWHYIGWAKNLMARLSHHRKGTGARFLKAVNERGIHYEIVKVWEDETKDFERLLKNRKNAKCLCPVCRGEAPSNHTGSPPNSRSGRPERGRVRLRRFFQNLFSHFQNFSSR
jgi:predicted GIY-YIG superfamily endonuclease